jgi:hypothetical protein
VSFLSRCRASAQGSLRKKPHSKERSRVRPTAQ